MRAVDLNPAGLVMGLLADADHDLSALATAGVWLVQWPDDAPPPPPGSRYVDGAFLPPLPPAIEVLRAQKLFAIRSRTAELLARGFEWPAGSGLRCGMIDDDSGAWATEMIGAMLAVSAGVPPPRWTHLDGSRFAFADAAEFQAFYAAGFATRAALQEAGADLAAAARAAAARSALDAVVDDR